MFKTPFSIVFTHCVSNPDDGKAWEQGYVFICKPSVYSSSYSPFHQPSAERLQPHLLVRSRELVGSLFCRHQIPVHPIRLSCSTHLVHLHGVFAGVPPSWIPAPSSLSYSAVCYSECVTFLLICWCCCISVRVDCVCVYTRAHKNGRLE